MDANALRIEDKVKTKFPAFKNIPRYSFCTKKHRNLGTSGVNNVLRPHYNLFLDQRGRSLCSGGQHETVHPGSVMDKQAKRQIVAGCLSAAVESGMAENRVSEKFEVPLRKKGFKANIRAGKTLDDAPGSGRPRSVRTLKNVTAVS